MSYPEVPIGMAFDVRNGATPSSGDEQYWDGDIPWVTPADLGALRSRWITQGVRSITPEGYAACGTQMVPEGSLILSTRAPIGHLAIAKRSICFNQGCRGLIPRSGINGEFAYWALWARKPQLEAAGQGSTFIELSRDGLRAEKIPVPDIALQRTIADFLDRETAKIDALIATQERLIALLDEKRQATITHAVTKGLDPNAPMKEGGDEMFPAIPAGWTVKRLKYLAGEVTVGVVVTPSKYYADSGVPALRSLNVRPMEIAKDELVFFDAKSNRILAKSMLRAGDLVAVRTGKPGTTAVIGDDLDGANCIDLILIRRSPRFDSRFLGHVLNSDLARGQFTQGSEGALQQHFNIETAKNLLLPVPPRREQADIARYLDNRLRQFDASRGDCQRMIDTLRERRTALITAAVTGQIDVSRAAITEAAE